MMRGVQRVVGVFGCFTREHTSLSLQEIADRIGLAKSTAFRLVQSLDEAGYLVPLDNQEYCLSLRFTRLAGLVNGTLDIREIARPVMMELAKLANEAITLNMVMGRERVCSDVINAPSPLMSGTKPGEHVRLVDGATAKTLMAYLPKNELQKLLPYAIKITRKKRVEILKELDLIRTEGYSLTNGERVLGVTAISAPIKDANDKVNYCVTVAGPTVRLQPRERTLIKMVMRASNAISRRMGAGVVRLRNS